MNGGRFRENLSFGACRTASNKGGNENEDSALPDGSGFLFCGLTATAEAGDSAWLYTSGRNFISSLEVPVFGRPSRGLELRRPTTGSVEPGYIKTSGIQWEGFDGSIAQGIFRMDANPSAALRDGEGNDNCVLECVANSTMPHVSRMYVVGEHILANRFPAQESTSLILADKSGDALWSHNWREHLYFEGIIPREKTIWPLDGWRQPMRSTAWPYARTWKATKSGAMMRPRKANCRSHQRRAGNGSVVNGFSDSSTTHRLKLPNSFLSGEQNFEPSDFGNAQSGAAASQTALDVIPYGVGYIVALRMRQPLADCCFLRYYR